MTASSSAGAPQKLLFLALALLCLWPQVSGGMALVMGIAVALLIGNPFSDYTKKHTSSLLAYSVVGLGAGMNLSLVIAAGIDGLGYTILSLAMCFGAGWLLTRLLKAEKEVSTLITIGTAICGGSAIAAVSPVMRASSSNISAALGVVFCLNALALFVFPPLGHMLGMNEQQFGYWAALAIHDTSSVVGASMHYGAEALQTATTVKLARALWIVPLVFVLFQFYKKQTHSAEGLPHPKPKYPWFILGFLATAAFFTAFPAFSDLGDQLALVARQLLVLTLFLIGSNLSLETLKQMGIKPLVLGISLWIISAAFSLVLVLSGFMASA